MIIVIEGPSAAGKTTWCRRFAWDQMIPERSEREGAMAPDEASDPVGCARYWVGNNAGRWSTAQKTAAERGWVACDTDPFKLHYSWTLWTTGVGARAYWIAAKEFCREAFGAERLGIADLVFYAGVDDATLRAQKAEDLTRTRSRHELHVRLAPALRRWYEAIDRLQPGRVQFLLPPAGMTGEILACGPRAERTGVVIFDRLMVELERGETT